MQPWAFVNPPSVVHVCADPYGYRELTEPRMLLDYITTILKSSTHPLGKNLNGFVDQFTYVNVPFPRFVCRFVACVPIRGLCVVYV